MDDEIENTAVLTSTQKKKYLGINLTKHVWDLHAENHKLLMIDIKDNLTK